MAPAKEITEQLKREAEEQIQEKLKDVDYDTKEYPVEIIVQKYLVNLDKDENELYLPDYQRDFSWDNKRRSKFIESVLIGLPIPYIFVADAADSKKGDGRLEIVDGSQRVRTLVAFVTDNLVLEGLEKLDKLNGFRFSDLPDSRKRRFNRRTLRMIELTERADEEVRRDIFERINTGSDELRDMEKRIGIIKGPMIALLADCAKEPLFQDLVPLADVSIRRKEREELVLRFFSYLENYTAFKHSVVEFLDQFVKDKNDKGFDHGAMKAEFLQTLEFVKKYYPNGFKKAATHGRTSRIRFEAIAVGTALALRSKPDLMPENVDWLDSKKLATLTTSDASNSRTKVVARIEYVRDALLGSAPAQ